MTAALRAELIKVRTTRLWWALLLGLVALATVNAVTTALFAGQELGPGAPAVPTLDTSEGLTAAYGAAYSSASLLAAVLGVLVAAGDVRHGTATPTFLAVPSRVRVVTAKLAVAAGFGVLYGLVAQLVSLVAAASVIAGRGFDAGLGQGAVLRSLALGVVGVAVWAVLGTGVGVLVRSQVAAVLVVVGWVFLGDLLLSGLLGLLDLDGAAAFTPGNASAAVVEGFTGFDLLPWWGGALLLLGYAATAAGLGTLVSTRRDVA